MVEMHLLFTVSTIKGVAHFTADKEKLHCCVFEDAVGLTCLVWLSF